MRQELEPVLDLARTLAPDQLPDLIGGLAEINAVALSRLSTPPAAPIADELLEVPEAAARLSVSPNYLYRHSRQFGFTKRIGRKLLFSSRGIEEYIHRQRPR